MDTATSPIMPPPLDPPYEGLTPDERVELFARRILACKGLAELPADCEADPMGVSAFCTGPDCVGHPPCPCGICDPPEGETAQSMSVRTIRHAARLADGHPW